jgi:proteasome assembly chaperone (PAC2) family protein
MMEETTYRSPVRKLLRFFHRSRDGWKRKLQQAKVVSKRLSKRVRKLEVSRDRWKERAKQGQQELRRLREELAAEKNALA